MCAQALETPQEPPAEAEAAYRDLPAGPSTAAAAAAAPGLQQPPRRSQDAGALGSPRQGALEVGLGRTASRELSAAGTAGATLKVWPLLLGVCTQDEALSLQGAIHRFFLFQ